MRVFPLIVAVVVCGCSKTATEAATPAKAGASQTAAATPAPPKPVPAQLPDVLARVNGEAVNKSDFDRAVQAVEGTGGWTRSRQSNATRFCAACSIS